MQFDTLPSAQGWKYTTSGTTESKVFSVDGTALHQNTIGTGLGAGGTAYQYYVLYNVIDTTKKTFTLDVTARVPASETADLGGFTFGVLSGKEQYAIFIDTKNIKDIFQAALSTSTDTTVFHDYQLEGTFGVGYRFYIDGLFVAGGLPYASSQPNQLFIGDGTSGGNARADVTFYRFTHDDVAAPTAPSNLSATAVSTSQIDLKWTASTDNIGVTGYQLYRDGALLATLGNVTGYSDTGLTAGSVHSYTVSACDAASNCSAQGSAVSATTTGTAAGTLAGLVASCPVTLAGGTSAPCTTQANYSDGTSKNVAAVWTSSNPTIAAIDASGRITAAAIMTDTPVTFSSSYTEKGVTLIATAKVTVTAAVAQAPGCSGTGKYISGITIEGGASKKAGETLDVNYCLKNFGKVSRFDIYVAVEMPDKSLLYMRSGDFFGTPIFSSSETPYVRNTLIPDMSGRVLSIPDMPLELPLGRYTFYAVPVLTGKAVTNNANWIGQISRVPFTLSW